MKRHNINVACDTPVAQHINKKTWNVDDIISTFEVNDLEFLSPILWIMNQPQEIMTWDKKSGEIVYMQHRIWGSNYQTVKNHLCRTNECSWNSPILQRTNYPEHS